MPKAKAWVIGFDLSLTAPAAVALPLDWKPGSWKEVRAWLLKPKAPSTDDLHGQLIRYWQIAEWALAIAAKCIVAGQDGGEAISPDCFVEGYGFSKNNSQASRLMENGGIVKMMLFRECNIILKPVATNTARKLFLGAVPKKDPKLAVQQALFAAGAPKVWEENICDAFVCCNYGLSEVGSPALMLHAPEEGTVAATIPRRCR